MYRHIIIGSISLLPLFTQLKVNKDIYIKFKQFKTVFNTKVQYQNYINFDMVINSIRVG